MPVLSSFYGIIVRMYREIDGKHKEDLEANWKLLGNGEQYFKIDPLR